MHRRALVLPASLIAATLWAPAAVAGAAPAAGVPAGAGARGTLTLAWGGISGAPITTWNGQAVLTFDPSAAARRSTLAAIATPSLGEAYRRVIAPQAARVTSLTAQRTETVLCAATADDGSPTTFAAQFQSSVASIGDGRVAFELTSPRVDLLTGRGDVTMWPYAQAHPDGGYLRDRVVLPGRFIGAGTYPCEGDGAPALRLPRILAPNGGGAVPVTIMDWLQDGQWRLRRTPAGWKVQIAQARRVVFSESRFGPQDTQAMDVRVTSDLYLAGSLVDLQARCRVPFERVERARSAAEALRWARRGGLDNSVFVGRRRGRVGEHRRFDIVGRLIDSQGRAPCHRGRYAIRRIVKPPR